MYLSRRLLVLVYVGVGFVVAVTHDYFDPFNTWQRVLSAFLAILLWPLILLGIDLHIKS